MQALRTVQVHKSDEPWRQQLHRFRSILRGLRPDRQWASVVRR